MWAKSHELAVLAYGVAGRCDRPHWPLADQLRRAAQSVPANIAEGSGRTTNPQFAHHLQLALASARELEYFLLLAKDVRAIGAAEHATLEARNEEVQKMLVGLRRTVAARSKKPGRDEP